MPAATFEHYQVLMRADGSRHELGRGAMGITYKAIDANLQMPVALKVINAQTLQTPAARENFVREARAAARLRHPHVASVFHLGLAGEECFYAMEYIPGETAECVVQRRGALPPRIAVRIALQVARALGAAEEQGLVHRDLKPANLMLVSSDEELCVKVIDFGLARSVQEKEAGAGFAGTPHFASPEQLRGEAVDLRSDFYSLGATLWYLLTGRPPFAGLAERTGPPPRVELGAVPEPVAALVARLLAPEPGERPQTAAALRQELEAALAGTDAAADEEREIALETRSAGAQAPLPGLAVGEVIAGRLQITGPPEETNTGWTCRAQDHESGREVRLLILRQDFRAAPAALTALEREVELLAAISHPHLLAIYGLERLEEATLVITEWCEGISLREILRLHRELTAPEALALLAQLAEGMDGALAAGLPRLDLSLHGVLVHFPGNPGRPPELVREPLAEWPPFAVKLNPLILTRELTLNETWSGGQTVVERPAAPRAAGGLPEGPPCLRELPRLVYELLGGVRKAPGAGGGTEERYTPLANLTEEGNGVLRQALEPGHPPASGAAFLQALRQVEQLEMRSRGVPLARAEALRPAPAVRRSLLPFAVAAAVGLGGAGAYVFTRTQRAVPVAAAPATPEPGPEPEAEPPVAAPAADPHAGLKEAVAQAEQTEAAGDLALALPAWISIARTWPDAEAGRMRMELLLDKVRLRQTKLSGPELESALPALREAAGEGVVSAMLLLGDSLQERDPAEAFRWFAAAGAKGVPVALTQLGLLYSNGHGVGRDLAAAVDCFARAAAKGDPAAKAALGECYLTGKGVARDEPRAIELLQEAAGQGILRAMNRLATCYHQGTGVPRNFPEALRLYQAAAEGGFAEAIGNLGVLYINGDGVAPSPRKAVELFQKGAGLGDGYCMYQYARCLESGTGLAANAGEAQGWYQHAAATGFPRAVEWCRQHGVEIH